jgi:O-antigen ligase
MRPPALTANHTVTDLVGANGILQSPLPVWAALFLNVLAFSELPTLIPVPAILGQMITQGALIVAFMLALLANPRGIVRPNVFLVLLTVLAVLGLMVSIHNQFILGSTYRALRLIGFTAVLWLLTPWWGRPDFVLLRSHLACLRVVLGTVLVGLVLAPGKAFSYGNRLSGALWPVGPTQVAHYAAVLLGCTVVLWFGSAVRGRTAVLTLIAAGAAIIGAHTRTALLAFTIALLVAGASMFMGHARVRRTAAALVAIVAVAATFFAPFIVDWLYRGQTAEDATQLTGRTKVWAQIVDLERPWLESVFGWGLTNKSFNGLSVDNNWLAVYLELGWFGLLIDAMLVLILIYQALTIRDGIRCAVAIFLIAYCLVVSITETGLGDASPYVLELVIAASLLAPPTGRR